MQIYPLAEWADSLAVGFGVAAAALLIGGSILLRWQRARLRFALAKISLEKGAPLFPGAPPLWLMSLRQGILLIAMGAGLIAVGGIAIADARHVPDPPESLMNRVQPMPTPGDGPNFRGPPRGPDDGPDDGPGFPPRPNGRGPAAAPPPPRPAPIPALERWHRAQEQRTLGLAGAGVGIILLLLGIVRTFFASIEKKYSPTAQEQ